MLQGSLSKISKKVREINYTNNIHVVQNIPRITTLFTIAIIKSKAEINIITLLIKYICRYQKMRTI